MDAAELSALETAELTGALRRMGLAGPAEQPLLTPLAGGVSSLIVRAEVAGRVACIKRALGKLKVASDWSAPIERSDAEAAWLRVAAEIVPGAVPALLGQDLVTRAFAMAYLDPAMFPVWKNQLLAGQAQPATAQAVAHRLAAIHNATARRGELAAAFANHDNFFALRLDPYFGAAALRHPDLAPALQAISARTAATRLVLVHGDVSPKNILIGVQGPILLDAECATYGDPAFDIAFCLNHLLLKGIVRPDSASNLLACYTSFVSTYLAAVRWEPVAAIARRTSSLLPALLLARVDGKSPVEYLTGEAERELVRTFARRHLAEPGASLLEIRDQWSEHLR